MIHLYYCQKNNKKVLPLFKWRWIIRIIFVIMCINPVVCDECIDTVGWNDQMKNFTCADYISLGWCVNKTVISTLQNNSLSSLNFPDLNCCACGKKASLKLPVGARWAQNGIRVAGAANGSIGGSLDMLNYIFGIFYADDDILYIADSRNSRVVLIALNSTTAIRVIGPESEPDAFQLKYPTDVFVTRTSIYVMDTARFRVEKWSRNFSDPTIVAGVSDVKDDTKGTTKFNDAYNLFVDNYGNLFVGDYGKSTVMRFSWNSTSNTAGIVVAGANDSGSNPDQLNGPGGLFVTDDGILYVTDCDNHRIQKWIIGASSGTTVAGTGFKGRALSQLNRPFTVLVDLNGYIYITDFGNNRIMRWAPGATAGECIVACSGLPGSYPNQVNGPSSMTFDPSGSLYVSERGNNRVQKFEIVNESNQTTISSQTTTIRTIVSTANTIRTMNTTRSTLSIFSANQNMTESPIGSTTTMYSDAVLIRPRFAFYP